MGLLPVVKMGRNGALSKRSAERMIMVGKVWFDCKSNKMAHSLRSEEAFTMICNTISQRTGINF